MAFKQLKTPLTLLLLLLFISGCSFLRPAPQYDGSRDSGEPWYSHPEPTYPTCSDSQRERELRSFIAGWRGVPYRYGGNDQNGVDCSGLAQIAMREVFDVELPRTTATQIQRGSAVESYSELRSGDLLFFNTERGRHVALFLGDGEIGHATISEGVTVSNLSSSYWSDTYYAARRVLPQN